MEAMRKRSWSDFSNAQKTGIVLAGTVQITLLIAALIDIRRRPAEQIRGGKLVWTAVSFINFIGPISYFVFGRKRSTQ